MPSAKYCPALSLLTGNPSRLPQGSLIPELTTETALNILISWLQDNIYCDSEIIFDNDEDNTDSAKLLPWIEQA